MRAELSSTSSAQWDDGEIELGQGRRLLSNRRLSRRHRRTQAGVEVIRDGDAMPFECFDLSAVGLYLHAELLLDLGENVELRIDLPGRPRPISAKGQVIRAQTDNDGMGAGMGVAFREISRQDQACLERYLMRRFLGHG
ncbi:MAG: PilZ domain-containing protein [Myxococcota bacterium]|nr:PilZ domain-containing protein [Myxococcota bacterium]